MSLGVPFVVGSQTSFLAAVAKVPTLTTCQLQVAYLHHSLGAHGATNDEVEHYLGSVHQSASPRRRELVQYGLLVPNGEKRETRNGGLAAVHVWAGPATWDAGEVTRLIMEARKRLREEKMLSPDLVSQDALPDKAAVGKMLKELRGICKVYMRERRKYQLPKPDFSPEFLEVVEWLKQL